MKTAFVSLCIVVIALSEPLEEPPTKRETILINTSNLNPENISLLNDNSCQKNGTSLYARYIEKRLDSINDKTQRLLCEHLIDSSIYKALLGELTSNSEILESNEIRNSESYVPPQELAAYTNSDSTETEYTPPPLTSRPQVYTPSPQRQPYTPSTTSEPSPQRQRDTSSTTPEPSPQDQRDTSSTTSEYQPEPITSPPGSSTTSEPQEYTPSTTTESQVFIRSTTLEDEPRPLTSAPASSTEGEPQEYTPPPPMVQPMTLPPASSTPSTSLNEEELLMGTQTEDTPTARRLSTLRTECQVNPKTYVNEALLANLRVHKENRQVQLHMFCVGVKAGFIRPDGILNEKYIKRQIESFMKGQEIVNEVYRTCYIKKRNKEETFTYFWLCLTELRRNIYKTCVVEELSCSVKFFNRKDPISCRKILGEQRWIFTLCCEKICE